jgi:hypothetical protein
MTFCLFFASLISVELGSTQIFERFVYFRGFPPINDWFSSGHRMNKEVLENIKVLGGFTVLLLEVRTKLR